MQLYDAFVRPSGDLTCAIPKNSLTAAEIILLRKIHGPDAVVDIKKMNMDKRSHRKEYLRLSEAYTVVNPDTNVPLVVEVFGLAHAGVKLPVELLDMASAEDEDDEDETEQVQA